MAVIASTSDDYYANYAFNSSDPSNSTIRVPKNSTENRRLKYGHAEDDNSDIAYLNFSILIPSILFTTISVACFIAAVAFSLKTDYLPNEQELARGFIVSYGSSRFRCNNTLPIPSNGLPSILNLFELNVIGNVLFRYSTCIPIIIRIFHSFTIKNLVQHDFGAEFSSVHKLLADSMPMFCGLEALTLALFSIITVHEDFPEANRLFKIIFSMSSIVNMLSTTIVIFPFSSKSPAKIDNFSICLKICATFLYSYFMPQYIQYHQASITFPICHSYLPRAFAYMEYTIILSYAIFHLSTLIDLRHISFICYPRSSSGECEPLDPKNFEIGAKYQHCRAFEFNQRRIMSL
ncbi:unnamed protein product [Caenorhabditis angaria]|uniref:Uncharacterized protein n=1 Tax=Caenorhabditis angaria TaxID=860376 RepID=A0A9P1IHJ5_9PELO|nr:unnamed protein product [Caenorhabditis angaria]